ncbi:uncharacterized protein G2W53_003870 [Senna tora]|uniref:Uncharacterized protein n=1 Tax=Senna tora TaxID=362788 RepID=A0A834XBD2_9FABA|nr:uncharacterized protein G2W53_003870 [Senna tora]
MTVAGGGFDDDFRCGLKCMCVLEKEKEEEEDEVKRVGWVTGEKIK